MSTNSENPSPNLNTLDCDDLRQLIPAYVIGATTPEEAQQVAQLLPLCPDVASELEVYASMTQGLAIRVEAVEPPAHLRKAFLDRVAAEAAPLKPLQRTTVPPLDMTQTIQRKRIAWGAVAAVFIVMLATNAYWLLRVNTIEENFASLQQEKQTIVTLLNAERLQRITLQSTTNTEMLARVFWNPETNNGTFYTDRFPTLDKAHTYQIWLIQGDQPTSVGTFGVNASGEGLLTFMPDEDLNSFAAIAISVEPAGGSPSPTTDPMALGEIRMS